MLKLFRRPVTSAPIRRKDSLLDDLEARRLLWQPVFDAARQKHCVAEIETYGGYYMKLKLGDIHVQCLTDFMNIDSPVLDTYSVHAKPEGMTNQAAAAECMRRLELEEFTSPSRWVEAKRACLPGGFSAKAE